MDIEQQTDRPRLSSPAVWKVFGCAVVCVCLCDCVIQILGSFMRTCSGSVFIVPATRLLVPEEGCMGLRSPSSADGERQVNPSRTNADTLLVCEPWQQFS